MEGDSITDPRHVGVASDNNKLPLLIYPISLTYGQAHSGGQAPRQIDRYPESGIQRKIRLWNFDPNLGRAGQISRQFAKGRHSFRYFFLS